MRTEGGGTRKGRGEKPSREKGWGGEKEWGIHQGERKKGAFGRKDSTKDKRCGEKIGVGWKSGGRAVRQTEIINGEGKRTWGGV